MWKMVLYLATNLFCYMSTGSFYGRLASSNGMARSAEEDDGGWVKKMGCYVFEHVRYLQFSGSTYNLDYGVNGYHCIHWKLNQFLHAILENGSPNVSPHADFVLCPQLRLRAL